MKNKITLLLILSFIGFMILPSFSQTSSSKSSKSSSSRTTRRDFRGDEDKEREERQGYIRDFVVAVIGTKLRHPDPQIRMQALQSILAGILSGEGEGGGDENEGLKSYFSIGTENDSGDTGDYVGAGAAAFIPDIYSLLKDPDPEIRDVAGVGLDALFGSDVTLLRFMDDPDPVVRKYATKIYIKKALVESQDDDNRSDNENRTGDLAELLALRTLLVRLKYETDEGVRKTIEDSIEYYLTSETGRDRGDERGYVRGVDSSIIKYLGDSNPEIRKNAAKIIGDLEYNPGILNILMEALRKENNSEVKEEIQASIDKLTANLSQVQKKELR